MWRCRNRGRGAGKRKEVDSQVARPEDATDRPIRYDIARGRVQTRSLEAHVVDHCNLTCWGCCSLSPFLPEWTVRPEDLRRDLKLARRVLAPRIFKLVGGEPLLHPRLLECLKITRASGIAPMVSVTTNALLLPRMDDAFWDLVDALTISLYPKPPLPEEAREAIEARAEENGVSLNWKVQREFVDMTRDEREADERITREVWRACWLRRRCHLLRDGWFYTCTRPVHFDSFYGGKTDFGTADGVKLHEGPDLLEELYAALVREEPLKSCALCRGGDAEMKPHHLLSGREVRKIVEAHS